MPGDVNKLFIYFLAMNVVFCGHLLVQLFTEAKREWCKLKRSHFKNQKCRSNSLISRGFKTNSKQILHDQLYNEYKWVSNTWGLEKHHVKIRYKHSADNYEHTLKIIKCFWTLNIFNCMPCIGIVLWIGCKRRKLNCHLINVCLNISVRPNKQWSSKILTQSMYSVYSCTPSLSVVFSLDISLHIICSHYLSFFSWLTSH